MTVNGSKFPQYTYQIKLVVKPGPSFNDGGSVHHQAGSTLDLGQVTSRNGRGRLEEKKVLDQNTQYERFSET